MSGNQSNGKGFFRGLLSGNSSRPTLLRGESEDHNNKGVIGYAYRDGQEQTAIHS